MNNQCEIMRKLYNCQKKKEELNREYVLLLGFYISLSFNKTYLVNSKDNNEQNNE